jgi:hypothetical protein
MSKRVQWLDGAGLVEDSLKPCRHMSMVEHSLQPNTSSMVEPSSKSKSILLLRVTHYKQEQPAIETDPKTILRNSLITTNFYPNFKKSINQSISQSWIIDCIDRRSDESPLGCILFIMWGVHAFCLQAGTLVMHRGSVWRLRGEPSQVVGSDQPH